MCDVICSRRRARAVGGVGGERSEDAVGYVESCGYHVACGGPVMRVKVSSYGAILSGLSYVDERRDTTS